jgi:hypothetical protein
MKLRAKILGVAGGGSPAANPFTFFHSGSRRSGEYQRPPSRNADIAATRMAQ